MTELLKQLMALHVAVVGMTVDDEDVRVKFQPAQIVAVSDTHFWLQRGDDEETQHTIERVKMLFVRPGDE